ncbi:hypothetical protein BD770DRAFT_469112 [Pilaira anomala]|nr:hypothetical protein BD770DRAFT_469112 [Pilaira anomala]
MKILYKIGEFPDPGDRDLYNGIEEINKENYKDAFKNFEKGSNYDNEYALLFTAMLYYTGFGFAKRDPAKAMSMFKKIALEWKTPVAQYLMGVMYLYGDKGISQHQKQSLHWLTLAAENGWSDAMAHLGYAYLLSDFIEKDEKKAVVWIEKVAKKDDEETKPMDDGTLYLFGNKNFEICTTHAEKNMIATLDLSISTEITSPIYYLNLEKFSTGLNSENARPVMVWNALANKKSSNVAACQMLFATMLRSSPYIIAPNGRHQSIYWAKKAAKNGSSLASMFVARAYETGDGVHQDYKEAIKWYKITHERKGDIEAAYRIGVLYHNGRGVVSDCQIALKYFNYRVLEGDHGPSYLLMGDIYEHGRDGAPQCYKKAYHCYLKSSECGVTRGSIAIGKLYRMGLGVPVDNEKAFQWISKAVAMDCPIGYFNLGHLYLTGYRGKIDVDKALPLLKRAADGGHFDAVLYIALAQEIKRRGVVDVDPKIFNDLYSQQSFF